MGLLSFLKKDKAKAKSGIGQTCFNCKKKITKEGWSEANGRYCCGTCCGNKKKDGKTCEFC